MNNNQSKIKTKSYKAILAAFTEYLQTLGYAASTVYDYSIFASSFLRYIEQKGIQNIQHLTQAHLYNYYAFLEKKRGKKTKKTYSSAHLNRNFGAVDKFLEFLHQTGAAITVSPTKYTLEHNRQRPLQILTKSEIQQLYDSILYSFPNCFFVKRQARQMALKTILDLCYGCGLRKSEAQNLQLKDIHFDQKLIHVRQGKNYKDRFVPMSPSVFKSIQNYTYNHRRYYARKRPDHLLPFPSIYKIFKNLLKICPDKTLQTKNPNLHTLRHSIATHLLQNGMSIENISRFLGHSTLVSTQIYTHIINETQN